MFSLRLRVWLICLATVICSLGVVVGQAGAVPVKIGSVEIETDDLSREELEGWIVDLQAPFNNWELSAAEAAQKVKEIRAAIDARQFKGEKKTVAGLADDRRSPHLMLALGATRANDPTFYYPIAHFGLREKKDLSVLGHSSDLSNIAPDGTLLITGHGSSTRFGTGSELIPFEAVVSALTDPAKGLPRDFHGTIQLIICNSGLKPLEDKSKITQFTSNLSELVGEKRARWIMDAITKTGTLTIKSRTTIAAYLVKQQIEEKTIQRVLSGLTEMEKVFGLRSLVVRTAEALENDGRPNITVKGPRGGWKQLLTGGLVMDPEVKDSDSELFERTLLRRYIVELPEAEREGLLSFLSDPPADVFDFANQARDRLARFHTHLKEAILSANADEVESLKVFKTKRILVPEEKSFNTVVTREK